jgi:hypothetical protein
MNMTTTRREMLSRIMKDAWRRVRLDALTLSKALKAAWKAERKAMAYAARLVARSRRGMVFLKSPCVSAIDNTIGSASPYARQLNRRTAYGLSKFMNA